MGENEIEGIKAEARIVAVDRTVALRDRIKNQKIRLGGGISIEDLLKMDADIGEKEDWNLVEINLGRGRLYPRGKFQPDRMANDYECGDELGKGERGLTPAELLSMLKDNLFGGLRGVFIPGLKKGELLLLDLGDSQERTLSRCPLSDVPNHAIKDDYAFPTVKIPIEK